MHEHSGVLDGGALAVVQLHLPTLRVDDDHERRTRREIRRDLIVDVGAPVVGRENLDGDVGCKLRDLQSVAR
jgi:hypothetical protein